MKFMVVYATISNAKVKREHLHQIFRFGYTSNKIIQIIQIMQLHTINSSLWNWYSKQPHSVDWWTYHNWNVREQIYQGSDERTFVRTKLTKYQTDFTKTTEKWSSKFTISWKRGNKKLSFEVSRISKNKVKTSDFSHPIAEAKSRVKYFPEENKNAILLSAKFFCVQLKSKENMSKEYKILMEKY